MCVYVCMYVCMYVYIHTHASLTAGVGAPSLPKEAEHGSTDRTVTKVTPRRYVVAGALRVPRDNRCVLGVGDGSTGYRSRASRVVFRGCG